MLTYIIRFNQTDNLLSKKTTTASTTTASSLMDSYAPDHLATLLKLFGIYHIYR